MHYFCFIRAIRILFKSRTSYKEVFLFINEYNSSQSIQGVFIVWRIFITEIWTFTLISLRKSSFFFPTIVSQYSVQERL